MRNKVEIRAFAVEQVVKMKFVDECNASKIVEEAKVLEEYITGGANIPECVDDISSLINAMTVNMQRVNADLKPNEAWAVQSSCSLRTEAYRNRRECFDEVEQGGVCGCTLPPCLRFVALWVDGHGGGGADGRDAAVCTEAQMLAWSTETEVERKNELATYMQRTANGIVYEQRKRAELCRADVDNSAKARRR